MVLSEAERSRAYYAANRDRILAQRAAHRKTIPHLVKKWNRHSHWQYRYQLTQKRVQQLLQKQNGACAICTIALGSKFDVDHDHKSYRVRGLLCYSCNTGIGFFHESKKKLLQAARYVGAF